MQFTLKNAYHMWCIFCKVKQVIKNRLKSAKNNKCNIYFSATMLNHNSYPQGAINLEKEKKILP